MLPCAGNAFAILSVAGPGSRNDSVNSEFGVRMRCLVEAFLHNPESGKDIFRLSSSAADGVFSTIWPRNILGAGLQNELLPSFAC